MTLEIGYGTCHICKKKFSLGQGVVMGSNEDGIVTLAHKQCCVELENKKEGENKE